MLHSEKKKKGQPTHKARPMYHIRHSVRTSIEFGAVVLKTILVVFNGTIVPFFLWIDAIFIVQQLLGNFLFFEVNGFMNDVSRDFTVIDDPSPENDLAAFFVFSFFLFFCNFQS